MALFCSGFVEVVFLYRSQSSGINCGYSGDQCVLFSIFGFVWNTKYPVHLRQRKPICADCNAGRDLYIVADEVGVAGYLSARFVGSRSPIWNVGSVYACVSLLHNFTVFNRMREELTLRNEILLSSKEVRPSNKDSVAVNRHYGK